uniref:Uncharacterized protein n=1 Tax=Anguilla anguilla TaxID=7936 RepID=A0A0E9URQ4_ANGAN
MLVLESQVQILKAFCRVSGRETNSACMSV